MSSNEETQILTVRLPASLVKSLDRHAERISEGRPDGARAFSRSDAIRTLLLSALAAAGEEAKRRK